MRLEAGVCGCSLCALGQQVLCCPPFTPLLPEVHHWSPLLQFSTRSKARGGFVSVWRVAGLLLFRRPASRDKDFSAICNLRRVLQQKLVDADLFWMVVRLLRGTHQGISTTHFGLPAHLIGKRQKNSQQTRRFLLKVNVHSVASHNNDMFSCSNPCTTAAFQYLRLNI